jgi:hypothetical protein
VIDLLLNCLFVFFTDCVYKGRIIANGTVTKLKDECLRCGCNGGFLSCCS